MPGISQQNTAVGRSFVTLILCSVTSVSYIILCNKPFHLSQKSKHLSLLVQAQKDVLETPLERTTPY